MRGQDGCVQGAQCPGAGSALSILASTATLDLSTPLAARQVGPPLPVAVEHVTVAATQARFYAMGGATMDAYAQDVTSVLSWAPGEATWTMEGNLPSGETALAALSDGATIVLVAEGSGGVAAYVWKP